MADNVIFKTGNIEEKAPAKVKGQVLFSVNDAGKGEIYFDKDENTRVRMSGASAEKLEEAVSIGLSGDITGSTSFDGSQDVTITATLKDNYAGSAAKGGAANAALKLVNSSGNISAGDSSTPVYFENGIPKAVTSLDVTSDKAKQLDPGAKINGTLFTGVSDITTDTWGTARNISISDATGANTGTAVSVNGSKGVTLLLPATIVATLKGKADSAGHADTADSATTATSCSGNAATATTWANNVVFGISNKADGSKATINGDEGTATLGIPATITGFTSISSTKFVGALEGKATSAGTADSATNAGHATTADSATTAETAGSATKLTSGAKINGTNFDGSADITTNIWGTTRSIKIASAAGTTGTNINGAADSTTNNNNTLIIPKTLTGFTSIESGTFKGALDGNAKTATSATNATNADKAALADKASALETARSLQVALGSTAATSFDGSANATIGVSGTLGVPNGGTGTTAFTSGQALIGNGTGAVTTKPITSSVTANSTSLITSGGVASYAPSKTGVGASGDWGINITGSASKLTTKRTINGTEFDGSGNITTANWGTARNITIGNTQKSVNGSQAYTWTLNEVGALPGKTTSATTAATAGWYRIATSAVSETNNLGQFTIQATPSGKHCLAIINAGISYGKGVNLQQMSFVNYTNSPVLTKARIVYHTTYSNNYAYLEVYVSSATATPITVQFTGFGWSLVTPSTAGSIPSGYTSKEITFVAGSIVSNLSGKATTAGTADKAAALSTARSLLTHLDSTGAASFDGSGSASIGVTGTLGVPNGGTGNTTFTAGEVLVGNGTEAIETKAIDTSVTSNSSNLITSGAVATYAPSKTGSGASGNWGINVTGSAGSLSAKPTINGTEFNGTSGITTKSWGPTVSFTTTDGTNTSTAVTSTGESKVSIKLPSTIKATLQGKATSAGTADNATNAGYATSAGTATSAGKLTNKIKIGLTGDVTGSSAEVDLSGNVTISTTVADDGHNHTLSTITDSNTLAKKDGSNATGTWGIGITGNAATASKWKTGVKLGIAATAGSATVELNGDEGTDNTTSLQIPAALTGFTSITSDAFVGRASSAGILTDANGAGITAGNSTTPVYFNNGLPEAVGGDLTLDVKVENAITAERWSKGLNFYIGSTASGSATAVYGPTNTNGTAVSSVTLNLPTTITNLTKIVATTFEGYLDGTAKKATNADNATNATNAANATVATKLGTADKGSATVPIYLDDGVPKACTSISLTAARATADADGNTFSTSYLKLAGGNMSDGATIKLSQYGNRFVSLTGNGFSFDLSSATGGWAGTFAGLKDPTGTTTTMLGYYGGTDGLTHVFMGGVHDDPAMKMDKDGNFTFKNTIVGNISGRAETAGSAATADTAGKWANKLKLGVSGAATGEIEFDGSEGTKSLKLTLNDVPWSKITGEPGNASTTAAGFMSSTDKTKLDNTNIAYGTCSTAAATAAKVITIDGNSNWTLTKGALITVLFTYSNEASNPTLNVNNTGAKSVYYNTSKITTSSLTYAGYANRVITYMYDGTGYKFISWGSDSNTDTKIRVYRQTSNYNGDYPILVSRTQTSGIGTSGSNSSYSAVYGVIGNNGANTPTINPHTGVIKAPGGFSGNLTGSVTGNVTGDLTGTADKALVADSLSQTLGVSGGGTGNTEFTANRIVFSKTNSQLAGASGHYISDTQISLGDSSAPSSGMEVKIKGDVEKTAGHIYLTGAQASSSTGNTTQLVFGTASDNHVAISSNNNALIINKSTTETTSQIVLYLEQSSRFPNGITGPVTGHVTGDVTGTADKAKALNHNVTVTFSQNSDVSGSFVLSSLSQEAYTTNDITVKDNSHNHTFANISDGATTLANYAKKDGSNVSGTWSNLSIGGNAATATKWAAASTIAISSKAVATSGTSIQEGGKTYTVSIPQAIEDFTSIESDKFVVNDQVTLQYNSTKKSLDFIFA